MSKISDWVNSCAGKIAENIRNKQYLDVNSLSEMIYTHFDITLSDILRSEQYSIVEKQNELMDERQLPSTPSWRRNKINIELSLLSSRKKEMRKITAEIEARDELINLKAFIREKYGDSVMQEFYSLYPKKEKCPRIGR